MTILIPPPPRQELAVSRASLEDSEGRVGRMEKFLSEQGETVRQLEMRLQQAGQVTDILQCLTVYNVTLHNKNGIYRVCCIPN